MRKIIVYPAGKWAKELLTLSRSETIGYFLDNDPKKQREGFPVCNGMRPVYPLFHLRGENPENIIVLISDSRLYHVYKRELEALGLIENVHFFNGWNLHINFYRHFQDCTSWQEYEQDFEINYSRFEDRARDMSTLIPDDVRSVLDLGCGDEKLRKYLPQNVEYFGLDTVKRSDATVVCDINVDALPEIGVDAYYMAGFLLYVNDIHRLFAQMKNGRYIIFDVPNAAVFSRLDARIHSEGMRFVLNTRDDYLQLPEIVNSLSNCGFVVEKMIHPAHSNNVLYCRARNLRSSDAV